jgi:hypothetical protein
VYFNAYNAVLRHYMELQKTAKSKKFVGPERLVRFFSLGVPAAEVAARKPAKKSVKKARAAKTKQR